MACPKCGCKVTYSYHPEWDGMGPSDDRLERCAACGEIFDIEDSADEDDEDDESSSVPDGVTPVATVDPVDAYWKGYADGEKHAAQVNAGVKTPAGAEPCWCDKQGIGELGVSCGDCPTRDYKAVDGVAGGCSDEAKEAAFQRAYDAEPDRRDDRRWFELGWQAHAAGVPVTSPPPPSQTRNGDTK